MTMIRATARGLPSRFNYVSSPLDLHVQGGVERVSLRCDTGPTGMLRPRDPRVTLAGSSWTQPSDSISYAMWGNESVPMFMSGHRVRGEEAGNTLTIQWEGTTLIALLRYASDRGTFTVSTDGGAPITVDTYSSTAATIATPYVLVSNLAHGQHTTVITLTGNKGGAGASTGTIVAIWGFDVLSTTDAVLKYATGTAYPAGVFTAIPTAGTLPALTTIGSALYRRDLIVLDKGATAPRAITGATGSASDTLSQFLAKNKVAFRVEAEDTNGKLAHIWASNLWQSIWDGGFSGWAGVFIGSGSGSYSDTSGEEYVVVGFVGTGIDLLTLSDAWRGIVAVSVDRGAETNLDLYSASQTYQKRFNLAYNLPYGYHQVKLRKTGTKNAASSAYSIPLDAFDVYHPVAPATPADSIALAEVDITPSNGWVRYDDAAGWVYTGGNWGVLTDPDFTGGTKRNNPNTNTTDAAQFTFTGTQYRLWFSSNNSKGKVALYLDGAFVQMLDLYDIPASSGPVMVYASPTLSAGIHTVEMRTTNSRNPSSSGNTINLDSIEVLPLPIQVRDVRNLVPVDTQTQANRAVVEHVSVTHSRVTPMSAMSAQTTTSSTTMVTLPAFNVNATGRSGWVDVDFTGTVAASSTSAIVSLAIINTTTGEVGPTLDFAVPSVAAGRTYSAEVRRAFQVPLGYTHTFALQAKTTTGTATVTGVLNVEAKGY